MMFKSIFTISSVIFLFGIQLNAHETSGNYLSSNSGQVSRDGCADYRSIEDCENDYPYTRDFSAPYEWRYVEGIGFRKFSPYGAMRKDWNEYKKEFRKRRYRDRYDYYRRDGYY